MTGANERAGGLKCIACSYSLVGLADDGVCPECGAAVASSVIGGQLRQMDPEYLKKLETGVGLVRKALVTLLCSFIVAVGVHLWTHPAFEVSRASYLFIVPAASGVAGLLMLFAGVHLASALDSSETAIERTFSARAIVRFGLPVSAGLLVLTLIAAIVPTPLVVRSGVVFGLVLLTVLAISCSLLAASRRLGRLLWRLGRPRNAPDERATQVLIALFASSAILVDVRSLGLVMGWRLEPCWTVPASIVALVGPFVLAIKFDQLLMPIGVAVRAMRKGEERQESEKEGEKKEPSPVGEAPTSSPAEPGEEPGSEPT